MFRKSVIIMATVIGLALSTMAPAMADDHCKVAGTTGLTADYVNEVPSEPFVVTCDIGVYFDEAGSIDGVELDGTVASAKPVQFGIYIDGAGVDVTNATVTVAEDYPHQFVSVTYRNGATGTISDSAVTGAHRAGISLRGTGTNVAVTNNEVIGSGAKTSGWAENGIQVDQGAVASITHNVVADHWWDGESNWASTGILLFANDSVVSSNTVTDNEFSVYIGGDRNEVKANGIESHIVSQSSLEFQAYGILIGGDDNALVGNQLRATDGAVGIYLYEGSENNTIRGGNIKGFVYPIYDGDGDNVVIGNPALLN